MAKIQIMIEIDTGVLNEAREQFNDGIGAKPGQVGYVPMRVALCALHSSTMRKWLAEHAIELATDSCVDVLAHER